MRTSVVIASYNGKKYILEQLESIRLQTVPVNEVLILDDCSTDDTVEICRNYIIRNQLQHWRVEVNACNQRTARTFWDGFHRVSGDIIFMSDQDDRWLPRRVETFIKMFEEHPDMESLATTFSRFNEGRIISKKAKHPIRKKNGLKKMSMKEFCRFPGYLGMACAFRRRLLNKIHTSFDGLTHDVFINFYATLNEGLYYLDQVLTERRSYDESVSSVAGRAIANQQYNGDMYLVGMIRIKKCYCHFRKYLSDESNWNKQIASHIKQIDKYTSIMETRITTLKDRLKVKYLINTPEYFAYFGLREVYKDLLYLADTSNK